MKPVITIEGNLGADPELRYLPSGKPVAGCRVAVTDRIKDGDQWVDGTTTWYEVSVWDNLAERVAENIRKGDKVLVVGTLAVEEWAGKDGAMRTSVKISARHIGVVPKGHGRPAGDERPF